MANKEGSFKLIGIVMAISVLIALLWNQLPWLKSAIHSVLDPSAGALLGWNLTLGMLIIVLIISLLTTIVQKYATDQKTLKELKKESKEIQKKMKELEKGSKEYSELTINSMKLLPRQMKLSMRAVAYTGVPFILLFRWFNDYFIAAGSPHFLGFLSWFWFYLLATLIFSGFLRKWFDVV